jgi:hypothetical protein
MMPVKFGRHWIDALPSELTSHGHALSGLLAHCEATPAILSLSVGCSVGRGAADELSDLDLAVGVLALRGLQGAVPVRAVEQGIVDFLPQLGSLIDTLRRETAGEEFFVRTVFAQYDEGLQLDLAVVADSEVRTGEAAPDFVELYRAAEQTDPNRHPPALHATNDQLSEWVFLGWRALLDADKYLRRRSLWEAHARLHQARDNIWRLWAAGHGALYPWHGLSQVLDHDSEMLPPGIQGTVAGLDHDELRRALLATADVLERATEAAEVSAGVSVRSPIAGYARRRLAAST